MSQELKVPIYINGSSVTKTERELFLQTDVGFTKLVRNVNNGDDIKVKKCEEADKAANVVCDGKLDTTKTKPEIDGTWTSGIDGKLEDIEIDNPNKDTKLSTIILTSKSYGDTLPEGVEGQLFFVIETT